MASKLFILRPTLGQGGAERVTLTLLQKLDRRQFDLSLVLVRREGELLADVPDDVTVHVLGARNLWTCWWPLARLLRHEKPDVLFSPGGTNVPAVLAKWLARIPLRLVLSERNVLHHSKLTLKRRLMVWWQRLLYPYADGLTAVSEGVKQDMVEKLHLPPARIQVIYNPIVDDSLATLAQEPIDHPWFHEDVPIVLGVGRLVVQKNFALLIRAFAQVRAQRPARLVILGAGPLHQELLVLAQELNVADDLWLPGFDKNPFKYMARADIFVLSSLHEGLPGALIQAMACGTAVISTDCPAGPNEIITPEQDGILIPVNDVAALVEQINRLLDNPELRQWLARQGQQSSQRFAVNPVIAQYTQVLGQSSAVAVNTVHAVH
ncbi:MAG: glycosyltransferase [Anaerolineae bacterium]|nr:glycosyltransferase [Anaerolineae bacterium]